MKFSNRKKVIFVGALFQCGSLMVIAVGLLLLLSNIRHAQASTAWPQVNGVVTAGVESHQVGGDANIGAIWYEYQVGGKTLRSNRVSFFEDNQLYKHPEGELVKVFYNPKETQDACLVTGVSQVAMFKLYFFGFAFICGCAMVVQVMFQLFLEKEKEKLSTAEAVAVTSIVTVLGGF